MVAVCSLVLAADATAALRTDFFEPVEDVEVGSWGTGCVDCVFFFGLPIENKLVEGSVDGSGPISKSSQTL